MEEAALELEEAEQYQQYQGEGVPHSAQRQVGTALCGRAGALQVRICLPTFLWPHLPVGPPPTSFHNADTCLSLQHGDITPVPGPTFTENHQASPAAAATAGNMSRAPSPAVVSRPHGGAGAAASSNPFARKPAAEQPENSPGNAAAVAAAAKRKAPASGNPFARRSKAAKA